MDEEIVLQKLVVEKRVGGSSDGLLTVGLAYLGYAVVGGSITIEDHGPHYDVQPTRIIDDERIANATKLTLIEPLVTEKQAEKRPRILDFDGFNLDKQRDKQREYADLHKALPAPLCRPLAALRVEEEGFEGLQQIASSKPHPDLCVYNAISAFKVADGFNALVLEWRELPLSVQREIVALLFQTYATMPNDIVGLSKSLADLHRRHKLAVPLEVRPLQIINPISGKGANSEKERGVHMDNVKELWPLALLKLVGYHHLAVPLPIPTGNRTDYKTYVLRPRRISVGFIDTVIPKYREVLWSTTAVKADILAVLRFVQVLVAQKQKRVGIDYAAKENDEYNPFVAHAVQVTAIAEGFDVTLSKSFANAMATMNLSVIGLPTWLPDITAERSTTATGLLEEHVSIIEAIGARAKDKRQENETRDKRQENETSEEITLLQLYRNFLSTAHIGTFLNFTAAYAPYLMSQSYRQRYVALLSTPNLEELMSATNTDGYTDIADSQGFRTLAYCIRESTINVQMYKGNTSEKYRQRAKCAELYEARYGLSHDLLRASKDNGGFIETLTEFVQSYCAENARVYESLQKQYGGGNIPSFLRRKRPEEDDLIEIVTLVKRYGAGVVCKMLLAFGYARSSHVRSNDEHNLPDDADTPSATDAVEDDVLVDEIIVDA